LTFHKVIKAFDNRKSAPRLSAIVNALPPTSIDVWKNCKQKYIINTFLVKNNLSRVVLVSTEKS